LKATFIMLGRRNVLTGGYVFNFRMAECLRAHGVEVDVIHFSTVPPGLPETPLQASTYIRRRVREFGPDVIIASKSYQYLPLLRMFNPARGTPVVYLVHHLDWEDQRNGFRRFLYRTWIRWMLSMAGTVWTNSLNSKEGLEGLGIPSGMISVISPGFDRPAEPPPDRSGRSGPVRLLCVGSFIHRKGQDLLIDACAGLPARSFRLDLAGGTESVDDCSGDIADRIRAERLEDSVHMLGELSPGSLDRAYREADILVHPARWEAFGMSLVEGMSRGLPVIASDVAAVPELVRNGENGILVEPGDVEGLGKAISDLLENREMRLAMGACSYRMSLEQPDWDQTCREFTTLVEETAGRKISR
jgi:glycosyltransferase involved in cell wall biosynthesis